MKLKKLFLTSERKKIGFKRHGIDGLTYKSYWRCSYNASLELTDAFKHGKTRVINIIDIYPAGIIAVRNFNETITIFAVENLEIESSMIGSQATVVIISRNEFDETCKKVKQNTYTNSSSNNLPNFKQISSIKTNDNFESLLYQFILTNGKDIFEKKNYKGKLLDYFNGEHKTKVKNLLDLIEKEAHRKIIEKLLQTGKI